MSNLAYPITETVFTSTDSSFSGIFQNSFAGNANTSNFGTSYFSGGFTNVYLELIANPSLNWQTSRVYLPNSNVTVSVEGSLPGNRKVDSSNSRMLYYEWTNNTSNAIELSQAPAGTQKDVYIRNMTGDANTFTIFGPQDYSFDDISGSAQYPSVSFTVDNNGFATFSYFYQIIGAASNIYITNYYKGLGLTTYVSGIDTYPTIDATLSTPTIFVNTTNSNITFQNAYPEVGRVTYYETFETFKLTSVAVPSNSTGNYYALGNSDNTTRWAYPNASFFRFAVLYKDSTNSNVYLPLGGVEF
jgi:hypothetical protein